MLDRIAAEADRLDLMAAQMRAQVRALPEREQRATEERAAEIEAYASRLRQQIQDAMEAADDAP